MDDGQTELGVHIRDTAQAIAELHAAQRAESTPADRRFEQTVCYVATPCFLMLVTLGVAVWTATNLFLSRTGRWAFDPPPFPLLQGFLTLLGVYVALVILSAQRRAGALDEMRAQLTLEHTILAEHKAAKMIELLEELRRDAPTLSNRTDEEATALAVPSDPKLVAAALVESRSGMAMEESEPDSQREGQSE